MRGFWLLVHVIGFTLWLGGGIATMVAGITAKALAPAERLAAYNLLSLPVCDASGFLLGAVTVDDVLDRTLPVGWRTHQ